MYLDLEDKLDLQKMQDISAFHTENRDKLIIMDEVQRVPQIFSSLRGIIDKERRRGHGYGQFLFLGSASMDLLQQSGESLVGRKLISNYRESMYHAGQDKFTMGENITAIPLSGMMEELLKYQQM